MPKIEGVLLLVRDQRGATHEQMDADVGFQGIGHTYLWTWESQ